MPFGFFTYRNCNLGFNTESIKTCCNLIIYSNHVCVCDIKVVNQLTNAYRCCSI